MSTIVLMSSCFDANNLAISSLSGILPCGEIISLSLAQLLVNKSSSFIDFE
jgi:hypothetical protein